MQRELGVLSMIRRALRLLLAFEPIVLLLLAPFLWFPRPASGLLLLVIPGFWLLRGVATGRISVRTSYDVPVGFLFVALPLSLLPVFDWAVALPQVYGLLLSVALVYSLANELGTPKRALFGLYVTVLVLGSGLAVVALVGTQWPDGKVFTLRPVYDHLPALIHGLFFDRSYEGRIRANEMAGVLAPLIPLSLAAVIGTLRRPFPLGHWLLTPMLLTVFVLLGAVLVLTQSRSGYAGATLGLMLLLTWWLVCTPASILGRVRGGSMLVVLVLVGGWLTWKVAGSWTSPNWNSLNSFTGRLEFWRLALGMLADFPFTGIGLGQFARALQVLYVPSLSFHLPERQILLADNFYLQLGLDLGVPGAVAVLFLIGAFLRSVWAAYRQTDAPQLQAMAVGLAAGMIAFLIYGLVDTVYWAAAGGIVFWVILGLGAALGRAVGTEVRPIASGRRRVGLRDLAPAGP